MLSQVSNKAQISNKYAYSKEMEGSRENTRRLNKVEECVLYHFCFIISSITVY